ncbi:hypothetical protein NQT74_05390 [Alteromonas stellipolaris]|nr:hypothetical protein [Alteromonas stellipolaris]MCQ8848004.1 hypothetical protein [Alteromonas stellipolaris]
MKVLNIRGTVNFFSTAIAANKSPRRDTATGGTFNPSNTARRS